MGERIDRLTACGYAAADERCNELVARENAVALAERLTLIWKVLRLKGVTIAQAKQAAERGITAGIVCKVCNDALCAPGLDHCNLPDCIPF